MVKLSLNMAEMNKMITFSLKRLQNSCRLIEYFVLLHSKY